MKNWKICGKVWKIIKKLGNAKNWKKTLEKHECRHKLVSTLNHNFEEGVICDRVIRINHVKNFSASVALRTRWYFVRYFRRWYALLLVLFWCSSISLSVFLSGFLLYVFPFLSFICILLHFLSSSFLFSLRLQALIPNDLITLKTDAVRIIYRNSLNFSSFTDILNHFPASRNYIGKIFLTWWCDLKYLSVI